MASFPLTHSYRTLCGMPFHLTSPFAPFCPLNVRICCHLSSVSALQGLVCPWEPRAALSWDHYKASSPTGGRATKAPWGRMGMAVTQSELGPELPWQLPPSLPGLCCEPGGGEGCPPLFPHFWDHGALCCDHSLPLALVTGEIRL